MISHSPFPQRIEKTQGKMTKANGFRPGKIGECRKETKEGVIEFSLRPSSQKKQVQENGRLILSKQTPKTCRNGCTVQELIRTCLH
jgi:hypothetical protein